MVFAVNHHNFIRLNTNDGYLGLLGMMAMSLCTVERCIIVIIVVTRGGSAILILTEIPRHRVQSRTRRRPMTISERSVTGKRAGRWVGKIYTRDTDPHRLRLRCRGVYYLRVFSSTPRPAQHLLSNGSASVNGRVRTRARVVSSAADDDIGIRTCIVVYSVRLLGKRLLSCEKDGTQTDG
ncbi:hypothetical protein QTP88_012070 [Uroleucon formosanum]